MILIRVFVVVDVVVSQDLYLGEYAGAVVNDGWMDVISSQGLSLLHVDLSGTDFTDQGLACLRDCKNTISLNLNYCHQISDCGLEYISGILSVFCPDPFSFLHLHFFMLFGCSCLGIFPMNFIHL